MEGEGSLTWMNCIVLLMMCLFLFPPEARRSVFLVLYIAGAGAVYTKQN